jgi:hypothetical protein
MGVSEPFAVRLTLKWIGGFFFWLLKGFRGKFSDIIAEKYNNRNMIVGFIIELIVLIAIVYYLFFKDR